jgi:hypothetical protein
MSDTAQGIRSTQLRAALRSLRDQFGYSLFRETVKNLERERLQVDSSSREPRKRFKPGAYKLLYHRQRGICPLCSLGMVTPRVWPGELEIDHIDPNRDDFGADSNLQLTHRTCNRKKGGKSILEQSKSSGRPFAEIVRVPVDAEGDPVEDSPAFLRKMTE